ncbi:MAG: ribose 5-phosphate isomerase B [Candidatus Omnitrophota bacterium]
MKKITIASDHTGFNLKEKLKLFLIKKGFRVKDFGTCSLDSCDYPDFVYPLAKSVSTGKYKRGILICKTGIGNSIVANKLSGIRAALCYNLLAAKLSREHNDSNILVMGSAFVRADAAKRIVSMWLKTPFAGGRHLRRVNKIRKIEKETRRIGK